MPVAIVFPLPDRYPQLDLVDDCAAGPEGLFAVLRDGADPDRYISDSEAPDAMRAACRDDAASASRTTAEPSVRESWG